MKLKRMFTLTLILALVCSTLAVTGAAADYSVNGRNGWSVTLGTGTVSNDNGVNVVMLNGEASVSIGTAQTGALLVTANVAVISGEATISAMSGTSSAAQATVSESNGGYAETKLLVTAAKNTIGIDAIKFNGNLKIKSVRVEKADIETPLFTENFDGYSKGEQINSFVRNSYIPSTGADDGKDNLSFTAADDNIADDNMTAAGKAGHLYDPTYTSTDTVRYDDKHSLLPTTKESGKNQETWYHDLGSDFGNYSHIKLRFKYYNAWNAGKSGDDTSVRDTLRVAFSSGNLRAEGSDMPNISIQGINVKYTSLGDDGIEVKNEATLGKVQEWSEAEVDMKIEKKAGNQVGNNRRNKVTYSVTIDGVSTPKVVHQKPADFRYLHMSIDAASGGGFYIDDIEVVAVKDLPEKYDEVLYSEDFENGITKSDAAWTKEYGTATSPGTVENTWKRVDDSLTFDAIVDPTASTTQGKVGKLEKLKRPANLDAGIQAQDGTLDRANDIGEKEYLNDEYWAYPLSDAVKNADNLKLSYKYYDEGIAYKPSGNGLVSANRNSMGVVLSSSKTDYSDDRTVSVYYNGTEASHDLYLNETKAATNSTKKWNDVTVNLTSITHNSDNNQITVAGNCGSASLNKTINKYNYLVFRVPANRLGRFYIDDIKITTEKNITANDVAQGKLDNLTKETVYSFSSNDEVETMAYEILDLTYENGSAKVKFRKWMDTEDKATVLYVASYDENGNMLECKMSTLSGISKDTLSNEVTLELTDKSEASAVKAFIWGDDLRPLAKRFVIPVKKN